MSGGGDQEVSQTSEPFRQQLPFVQDVFGYAKERFDTLPRNEQGLPTLEFFPGSTVAPQGADTLRAQDMARGVAGDIDLNNRFGQDAMLSMLRRFDPNDPTLSAYADSVLNPIRREGQLMLGRDDSRAVAGGSFGGSRAALTRGLIQGDIQDRMFDARNQVMESARREHNQIRQNALGMLPSFNEAMSRPAEIISRVGEQNDNFEQSLIDAERERFEFEQAAPDLALNQYANLINQFSGPTASEQRVDRQGSAINNVAGGVLAGAGARSLFS